MVVHDGERSKPHTRQRIAQRDTHGVVLYSQRRQVGQVHRRLRRSDLGRARVRVHRFERGWRHQQQHDSGTEAVGRRRILRPRPVARLQHVIAADFDHLAVQHEDAAGGVSGLTAEVADVVVADDEVLHVGHADRPIADDRQRLVRLIEFRQQRGGDRVRRDREVLDADDLQRFDEIEEPDRPDAVDLNVEQLARDDDPSAILAAGRTARDGQRDFRIAGPGYFDRHAGDLARRASVGADDSQAAERDAVAPGPVDFVFHDEDVRRRPADLNPAGMQRHTADRANRG